ncbi:hypothetical protein HMPREF1544_03184 [Mucor circinelloides 1006PhL]|uniref:HTH APSES-type domain-containing protein n=1 Tax=Mucor circinelloides f. circinelloides (strain 1006PhL) TaxID=1220926 RepID=S2JI09_MUCC1|nr:hypothetical protein HMPREF1544_03184 [Mucor circinelloides 1006PhL]
MDNLYQSPPYSYLPSATHANDYHQQQQHHHHTPQPMYRPSHSFDRPFNVMPPMVDDHHSDSTFDYYHHPHHPHHHHPHPSAASHSFQSSSPYGSYGNNSNVVIPSPRPKITTNVWEDEGTNCFQVDAKGICVARRQDNDMINGTKLLNVVGMSRGKRDGILKNEKGRVVVKVGAMHLKGVWIPFERARELAAKFKILDVLFPLFADEPSIYLCSPPIGGAQLDSNDMMPSSNVNAAVAAAVNKCNMVSSPLPAFNRSDEYNHSGNNNGGASPVGIPNWDRPSSSYNSASFPSSHYDDHHHPQQQQTALHRASLPDLSLANDSPVPRSNHIQHHPSYHQHHHPSQQQEQEESNLYLLNQNQNSTGNSNNPYDYYHRQFSNNNHSDNRGSFSSVSSHHSLLYPSLQHHHEDEASKNSSVTTPTSYNFDYNNGRFNNDKISYPSLANIGSSPYTKPTTLIATTTNTANNSTDMSHPLPPVARTGSAGSTTPSSWLSPETPTAVVFQQKDKEDTASKKRKSSLSIEPTSAIKRRPSILSPTSPGIRATRRVKVEHSAED